MIITNSDSGLKLLENDSSEFNGSRLSGQCAGEAGLPGFVF